MPNLFPCPNTQCGYQFDADILPAAAMVTCPLCRTKFPYRAHRPIPTPSDPNAADPRPSGPRVLTVRDRPKGANILVTTLWVVGFTAVLLAVVFAVTQRGKTRTATQRDAADERFNFKLQPFPPEWVDDVDPRNTVDANVFRRKRTGPEAFIAVAAQDFVDRQPRPGEVDEVVRRRLLRGFSTLSVVPLEGQTWAGKPALAYQFSGTLDDAQVRGEVLAMTFKGIVYAWFAWAAEADWEAAKGEATGLRERMTPANFRDAWAETKVSTIPHEGEGYALADRDGAWVRGKPVDEWSLEDKQKYVVDDVKEIDPAATMAFKAQYQMKDRGDNKRKPAQASALVVVLSDGGDPLEAAKKHVIDRIKRDYAGKPPEITLEPMAKSPGNVALPTGGLAIARFLFKDPLDRDNQVMYVISAANIGGRIVAVETQAAERDAGFVEEWMVNLAGSLKAK